MIEWVCRADHAKEDTGLAVPNVTVHDGKWAYCARGGSEPHAWNGIERAPIERIRLIRGLSEKTTSAAR